MIIFVILNNATASKKSNGSKCSLQVSQKQYTTFALEVRKLVKKDHADRNFHAIIIGEEI